MPFLAALALTLAGVDAGAVERTFSLTTGNRQSLGVVHDPDFAWVVTVINAGQGKENGVGYGDRLIKVDGIDTSKMALYELFTKVDKRPVELTYNRARQGTDPCTVDAKKELYRTIRSGTTADMLQVLETHSCDVNNVHVEDEELPLAHVAAAKGDHAKIRGLKTYGALVDELINGKTPLHLATENGHVLTVSWLVDFGSDPSRKTVDGWEAVHLAAFKCQLEVMKSLRLKAVTGKDKRVNLDAVANGKTPEMIARETNCAPDGISMADKLIEWRKKVKEQEAEEWEEKNKDFKARLGGEL